ncbi:MAG: hypothetical protein ABIH11_00300 [Candidatus Altiarchaeota archaeon]
MDEESKRKAGLMLGTGVLTGVMFNIAFNVSPVNPEGIMGGLIVGLLMYLL